MGTRNLYAQGADKSDTSSIIKNEPVPERYQNARPRIPILSFGLSAIAPLGLGQYYNKQYIKGGIITGIEAGSVIGFASTFKISLGGSSGSSSSSAAFGILFLSTYLYSIIDAPVAAADINDKYHLRHKKALSSVNLSPTLINSDTYAANKQVFGLKLTLR